MSDTSEEKEFDPTPQKLLDARKKGEIAKSTDLNTAAAYLGFLVLLHFIFGPIITNLGDILVSLIDLTSASDRGSQLGDLTVIVSALLLEVSVVLAPIFLLPAAFVLVSVFAQRSFVFAPTKIEPKLSRISIISGLKNKFGRAGLFEFFKSFSKLCMFMVTLAVFLQLNFDRIAIATRISPGATLLNMGSLLNTFVFLIFALALLMGTVDYAFQHADHWRKNRMSRKDLQDELKQAEGDPMMKQRRRQKALALATNTMMADVPEASVVIVNPTHYAVALKWDQAKATAPVVVAKGVDEVALRIRRVAQENAVPVHSDPPSARSLYAVTPVGEPISPDHYQVVATAIRFADDMRKKRARSYGAS